MKKSLLLVAVFVAIFSAGCVENVQNNGFAEALNNAESSGMNSIIYYISYSSPGGTATTALEYSAENGRIVSCKSCTEEYSSAYSDVKTNCSENSSYYACANAAYPEDIRAIAVNMTSVCPFNYTLGRKCFFGDVYNNGSNRQGETYEAIVCFGADNRIVNYQEQGVRPAVRWSISGYDEYINWQDVPEWYYNECG